MSIAILYCVTTAQCLFFFLLLSPAWKHTHPRNHYYLTRKHLAASTTGSIFLFFFTVSHPQNRAGNSPATREMMLLLFYFSWPLVFRGRDKANHAAESSSVDRPWYIYMYIYIYNNRKGQIRCVGEHQ